jgi:MFS transporter, AAHS family, cis,cis-muconate transporter
MMNRKIFLSVFFILIQEGLNLGIIPVALSSIMKDFQISSVQGGLVTSFVTFGMMIGGVLGGWLSDTVGRVKVTAIMLWIFMAASICILFSGNYIWFCTLELITSACSGGAYAGGTVLVAECIPTEKRNTSLGLIQAAAAIGYAISSLMSGVVLPRWGWRPLFLMLPVCDVVTLSMVSRLHEPEGFLKLKKASRKGTENSKLRMLFSDKQCRSNLLKWAFCSITLMAGFYAANSWLPIYITSELGVDFKSMTYYITGNYIMMFLGKISAGILSDRIGRRKTWLLFCLETALILPIVIIYATVENVGYLILAFGLFYGGPLALCSTFMNESFPTECRATGAAIAYNIGRIGSMTEPVILGYISEVTNSFTIGFFILAACYLSCGFGILLIKEKQFDSHK